MTNGLNYELIRAATTGNESAIKRITEIYMPYINTLASKKLFDEAGNEYVGIDIDLKDHLISKLIQVVLRFDAA